MTDQAKKLVILYSKIDCRQELTDEDVAMIKELIGRELFKEVPKLKSNHQDAERQQVSSFESIKKSMERTPVFGLMKTKKDFYTRIARSMQKYLSLVRLS